MMDMSIRPMMPEEKAYSYTPDQATIAATGCIGHLRGDMDSGGNGFYTSWDNHTSQMNDAAFKEEFNTVVDMLRFDERYGGILKNRSALAAYCYGHPASAFEGSYTKEFGFRADTKQRSYMIRCNPNKGDYNFYIYCFDRKLLDQHLQKTKAIRKVERHSVLDSLKVTQGTRTAEAKAKPHEEVR